MTKAVIHLSYSWNVLKTQPFCNNLQIPYVIDSCGLTTWVNTREKPDLL